MIYEGDAHRLGRGKAKWRNEVTGSGRKIRPQKGTGSARLGDKKSPMLRGGGVAHGPVPRDFSTGLPRKVYDLAWRTALSYRYKKNELLIFEGELEIQEPDAGLLSTIIAKHKWGNSQGRSLFITAEQRPNLEAAMKELEADARVLTKDEVDVKDLVRNCQARLPTNILMVCSWKLEGLLLRRKLWLGLSRNTVLMLIRWVKKRCKFVV